MVLQGELLKTHEITKFKQQKIPNTADLCIISLYYLLLIAKLKRNALFPTCSKSAPGKKIKLAGIKFEYK